MKCQILLLGNNKKKMSEFFPACYALNLISFSGPFVEGLEYATGTKAEVVGKPEKAFFTSAIEDLQIGCEECVMIGDVSGCF